MDTVTVLRPSGFADRNPSSKNSKSIRLPQVCIVCSFGWRNFAYELYMVDLNEDVCTKEFDPKIPQIQVDDFGELHFCVFQSILCMFEYGPGPRKSVYTFELPKNVFELSNYKLERDMVQCASLEFSKTRPRTINYGKCIVIFSTRIFFADSLDDDMHDFELYDVAGQTSQILPNLLIRPQPHRCYAEPRSYDLCNTKDRVSATFVGANSNTAGISSTFRVEGYSIVDDHSLVVQTQMGMVFQLNLQNPDEGWKKWDEGWLMRHASQFFVTDAGICLSHRGAYDMRIRDPTSQLNLWLSVVADYCSVTDKEYVKKIKHKIRRGEYDIMRTLSEVDRCLPYSTTQFKRLDKLDDFQLKSTVAGGCGCVCVVQMGTCNTIPHFIVDAVQLNVSKFPKHHYQNFRERVEELDFCVRDQKWAKVVKSVTFILPQSCDGISVKHVLPLMIGRKKKK